jgi:D-ornithine 4,5-aminomutase subunit beta
LIKPEVEWAGDGWVNTTLFLPVDERTAEVAALEIAKKMGLKNPEVTHKQRMHPSEGTLVEVKGQIEFTIDPKTLVIPEPVQILHDDDIRANIKENPMRVVAATVGEDEHSVGMREIIDIKHGGLEKFNIACTYLGTSVSIEKVVNAAVEINAEAILISTVISHNDVHRMNMKKLHDLCVEKGIRDKVALVAGGTQVNNDIAVEMGMDAGFGRGTKGYHVASFLVKNRMAKGK